MTPLLNENMFAIIVSWQTMKNKRKYDTIMKQEGDCVIYYATKETMQRYKLKTPDQLKAEIAPYAQAIVENERGNRLYEWGCKLFYFDS